MKLSDFEHFGFDPYDWQRECFLASAERVVYAEFSEPRCGKTKPIIDTARYRFLLGSSSSLYVDLCVIVAMPSGAPSNWEHVEVPKHCAPDARPLCLTWDADQASARMERGRRVWGSESWRAKLLDFENHKGLRFLCVNGEAILTEPLLVFLRRLFPKSRVMVVADESTLIMKAPPGPNGKRTAKMHVVGHQKTVVARRIMDGTPVGEGPLDLFGQVGFLDRKLLGFETFAAFRAHHVNELDGTDWRYRQGFANGEKRATELGLLGQAATDFAEAYAVSVGGKRWPGTEKDETGATKWKNLDELAERLKTFSVRVKRSDVYSSPAKVYQKRFFEMTEEQKRVYGELKVSYEAELRDGSRVEARNVLERLMRLQQVSSNFYPNPKEVLPCPSCDGEDGACPTCEGAGYIEAKVKRPPRVISNQNPRLEALGEEVEAGRPIIVWCRFHQEMDDVLGLLRSKGMGPVEYSGRLNKRAKEESKLAFQTGKAGSCVATQRSAGRAIALPARSMVYYTNEYSLLSRLQSEDRAEAPDNKEGTGVIDLVAEGTKDLAIVQALIGKRRVSDVIMNEHSGAWL